MFLFRIPGYQEETCEPVELLKIMALSFVTIEFSTTGIYGLIFSNKSAPLKHASKTTVIERADM